MARTPKVVEDRREQIIEAALRVFAQKGFDKATNKDIAHEAGITAGLIYHYFSSKEDLLRAALEGNSPQLQSIPSSLLELPPEKLLHFIAQQLLAAAESERFVQLVRIYLPEMIHNPEIALLGLPMIHAGVKFLADYLEAKMDNGELRRTDAMLTAQIFMGSIMDLVLMRQIAHDPIMLKYSHDQLVEHLVASTIRGLQPY
jgi:AcrR family transcriptional regulator